jgi:glycosyltransferase involved in cell wall biosynthesis
LTGRAHEERDGVGSVAGTLTIGVNLCYLRPGRVGGSEIYVRRVLEQLGERRDLRLVVFGGGEALETFRATEHLRLVSLARGRFSQPRRLFAENVRLRGELRRRPVDVLWSPANFGAPLLPRAVPQVVTVHDLQHLHLPENFSLATRVLRTVMFRGTFSSVTRIIAISDFTRADVLAHFPVSPERVVTVLEGIDRAALPTARAVSEARARHALHRPFFYYPATVAPHKNHRALLEAFALFTHRCGRSVDLVLTGQTGPLLRPLLERARAAGVSDCVRHLGYVDHPEVFELMRAAAALVFPSRFEGFGLPLLEAMQCRTPIIASNVASIPEVAGDAAHFLAPDDLAGWAEAMRRVTEDEEFRATLVEAGERNLQRFSWDRCASGTLEVLRLSAASPLSR